MRHRSTSDPAAGNIMIKIGDFSKLAHVSIKTLHHYGELGLVKPAHVDRYSGYRFYTLDQLPQLNRILAFKELGFSLEQIAQLLDENLSIAEMRGMLRMKQMELSQQLQEEQSRLARVEIHLRQIEQEGYQPIGGIAIKEIPSQTILSARVVAAYEEAISPARHSLQKLLKIHLDRSRLKTTSPWFTIISNMPYNEHNLEVELAIGVKPRAGQRAGDWGEGPVQLQELGEIPKMASVIHMGDYATLPTAYTSLYGWTQNHGYKISGSFHEIYLPESGISAIPDFLDAGATEVQCPVETAAIPISIQPPLARKEKIMEPKIVSKSSFKTVGISYIGKNEHGEIPQMWGVFNQRSPEINSSNDMCCYGLCFSVHEDKAKSKEFGPGEFEYVAAAEVTSDRDLPKGMVFREVPAYNYAVFTHHGKLDKLGETYDYIFNTWLPRSDFEPHPDKFDMEVYTDEFEHDSDDSRFYIYVAIKE